MTNDWRTLRAGDRIRLLRVPEADLRQREEELRSNSPMAGWAADTLERILAHDPIVTIARVDEYGAPWFEYELVGADGRTEHHFLTITENESWERLDS